MNPKIIELAPDDPKALAWIRKNLEVCANGHTLSRMLSSALPTLNWKISVIIPGWVDIGQLETYDQGSVPPDRTPYAPGESPLDALVEIVARYLGEGNNHVIVCENSGSARKTLRIWTWSRPPRFSCYGEEETYYILETGEADAKMINAALSDSLGHWGICVCSSCANAPGLDMPDESFLCEISQNTRHILMSAFDGDGYLICSLG